MALKRYPKSGFERSLKAWDAADEYILQLMHQCIFKDATLMDSDQAFVTHARDLLVPVVAKNIVIFNDSFGALSCGISALYPESKITVITDSYMSELGIKRNLHDMNGQHSNVNLISSVDMHDDVLKTSDLILLKVPKTKAYLIHQLLTISKHARLNTPVLSSAMVKLINKGVMNAHEQAFFNVRSSLALKKARLILSIVGDNASAQTCDNDIAQMTIVVDECIAFKLYNLPNVFCREQIDIGARFFLQHLPEINNEEDHLVDLGCGNGILGTHFSLNNPKAEVSFVDESYMAIESAKTTFKNSGARSKSHFIISHSLNNFHAPKVDVIICNPPFHQQHAQTEEIAWKMFKDAKKLLKKGGELRIVGNKHLAHGKKLKKIFGNSRLVATNGKFDVISAIN